MSRMKKVGLALLAAVSIAGSNVENTTSAETLGVMAVGTVVVLASALVSLRVFARRRAR